MAVIMVTARFLLADGTASTAVTTPFTSFVFAALPYLRWHSIEFVTCTAFACTSASTMNRGSLLLIFRSICEETDEEEQSQCHGQEFPQLRKILEGKKILIEKLK
jgi:hypothetical protein